MSSSIFNHDVAPEPELSVTMNGKKYLTVWSNVPENYQKCLDGGRHTGSLEIVTWNSADVANDAVDAEPTGGGCNPLEISTDIKNKFEIAFQL